MLETSQKRYDIQSALLVGIETPDTEPGDAQTLLEELDDLVKTLGITVKCKELVKIRKINASFLLGSGKAESIATLAKESGCELIVFDNELSPAQQRNWEKLSGLTVVDRQGIIIDIFASRAHTKEATLQVHLAQMEYFLPRLKNAWTHLSRQRGGGAMQRGVGELQLEIDQRIVRDRIAKLKRELKSVVRHRSVQRQRRQKIPIPTAAIIGYTNAGKSTLLNHLTGSSVLAEDKLFATLDPTTRRIELTNGQILLLTDTVGFVRRLPHRLVDAFKATLEEAVYSDFLIHVADASSPDLEHHMETTLRVMKELGADEKKIITVFNKIDTVTDPMLLPSLLAKYPHSCQISAQSGAGVPDLLAQMETILEEKTQYLVLLLPHDRYDLVNKLHKMGAIKHEKPTDAGVLIEGNIPNRMLNDVSPFIFKQR